MQKMVRKIVDQLLREQGEYYPLEFLYLAGRLFKEDFDTWSSSQALTNLEDMLFGNPSQIFAELREAEQYLKALGLEAKFIRYQHWQQVEEMDLVFSLDDHFNSCFHTKYAKSDDQPQMDMFMDNPAGNLVHEITKALECFDKVESRRIIERLYDIAPDQSRLGELEHMVNTLEQSENNIVDVAAEMRHLQTHIVPAARAILGTAAQPWLVPCWRRLSDSLANDSFQADRPDLHVSHAASLALDWARVSRSIEKESRWWQRAILVKRHAVANHRLGERTKAIQSWFYLCWLHPNDCPILESVPDIEMRNKWKEFTSLEPELSPDLFPAWLLLFMPGLIKILQNNDDIEPTALSLQPASYQTIYYRQKHHRQKNNPRTLDDDEIQWRADLKQQSIQLFQLYIALFT